MRRLDDELHLQYRFYGSRKLACVLNQSRAPINRKRVQRLMRVMGLEAMYQKPRAESHKFYLYILRNLSIVRPNPVWSADITCVPMPSGFMYLVAVTDWFSRYVLSWRLSNMLDGTFCLEAIEADQSLRLLVEKDFECLHNENEKTPDAFPNPRTSRLT